MKPQLARIHFAANDDRGNFTGLAHAVEIEMPDGDRVELAIDVRVARFTSKRGTAIRVGGRGGIYVRCFGWQEWVGNMCWDATAIPVDGALTIIRHLLSRGAVVESYDCGGTVEALVEEFRS